MAGARAHDFRGPHAACHAKLLEGKNLASPCLRGTAIRRAALGARFLAEDGRAALRSWPHVPWHDKIDR